MRHWLTTLRATDLSCWRHERDRHAARAAFDDRRDGGSCKAFVCQRVSLDLASAAVQFRSRPERGPTRELEARPDVKAMGVAEVPEDGAVWRELTNL